MVCLLLHRVCRRRLRGIYLQTGSGIVLVHSIGAAKYIAENGQTCYHEISILQLEETAICFCILTF
mgnify:FL=1